MDSFQRDRDRQSCIPASSWDLGFEIKPGTHEVLIPEFKLG
jgi:hypothetical protein